MKKIFIILLALILSTYTFAETYEFKETKNLVKLVNEAAKLVQKKGETSFKDFDKTGSKWRQKDTYIFVLDPDGTMLVHPDATLAGKNTFDLKDVNGRPIIQGLIEAAVSIPNKPEGWYHYQWPEPGEILPRWKSSFVKLVKTPSGKELIVGSGMYNDRMEKSFVVDMVKDAEGIIKKEGTEAFALLRDKKGRFNAKDAYIFVMDPNGIELVNPAHPNLEGRNLLDVKDTNNKPLIRDMLKVVNTKGSGWVNYMWPKPGESVPTQKSTYVEKVKVGDKWYLIGSGVYLTDAPKGLHSVSALTAPELMKLVRDGSALVEKIGEKAFEEFRVKGSKFFKGDTYFFVWDMDGTRKFHAADPTLEGKNGSDALDINDRPYGKMFMEVARSPSGEGWVHYMYPEPEKMFPVWKSAFLKRVTLPNGKQEMVGSASYNMQMDSALIEDVVNRASLLVQTKGSAAFDELRDKKGPYNFMDTYVFVDTPDGMELVNSGTPFLEGKNIINLKDTRGKTVGRDYISAAMEKGSSWEEYYWYKPGSNIPTLKKTFVRKVQSGKDTYIVGSGYYVEEKPTMAQAK